MDGRGERPGSQEGIYRVKICVVGLGVSLLLIFSVKVTSGEAARSRTACSERFNVSEMMKE